MPRRAVPLLPSPCMLPAPVPVSPLAATPLLPLLPMPLPPRPAQVRGTTETPPYTFENHPKPYTPESCSPCAGPQAPGAAGRVPWRRAVRPRLHPLVPLRGLPGPPCPEHHGNRGERRRCAPTLLPLRCWRALARLPGRSYGEACAAAQPCNMALRVCPAALHRLPMRPTPRKTVPPSSNHRSCPAHPPWARCVTRSWLACWARPVSFPSPTACSSWRAWRPPVKTTARPCGTRWVAGGAGGIALLGWAEFGGSVRSACCSLLSTAAGSAGASVVYMRCLLVAGPCQRRRGRATLPLRA